MTRILTYTLLSLSFSCLSCNAHLKDVATQFVDAAISGNSKELTQIYIDSTTREKAIKEFMEFSPMIQSKKIKITRIDKELVIGDLGVTLIRLDIEGRTEPNYQPLICVRFNDTWKIFPWTSKSDLKILLKQRSPDEQIHLQLFNEWAKLTEEQLTKMENKAQ
jgi:predicted acyl esterase